MIPRNIRNARGERLATTFVSGSARNDTLVVMGHGLTSDKDRPWSEGLCAALKAEGIACLRLAFSGNGESEGRFEDSNISKEVEDLGALFDALEGWRIAYIGHSMGGAVGALRTAQDERIRVLVSLAAVTHSAEFVRRMFGHLEHGEPMLDKPHCPYNPALEEDLLALDTLTHVASKINVPWLLLHGGDDEVVQPHHSIDMHAAAPTASELVELEGVDHSFSGDGLGRMVHTVVPWLLKHLR